MPAGRLSLVRAGKSGSRRRPPRLTKFKRGYTLKRKTYTQYRTKPHATLFSKYNSMNPFPQRMSVKQGYTERKELTAGIGTIFGTEQVYNMNNLFDPDFTGVGHQPYGRDTLATIYSKYKVTAVTVKVTWSNPTIDGVQCAMMLSPPNQIQAITASNYDTLVERPNVQVKILNNSGKQTVTQGGHFPMHKLAQVTKLQFEANITDFAALAGVGPSAGFQPHLRLAIADAVGGAKAEAFVELIYHAEWYDRIILPTS